MYLLNQQELNKIRNRVALAEVQNTSLSVDLVDHICCMIEERVERGTNLKIAEEEVFREMGKVQLKSIEIETKLLTQKKYTMKKRTKIIGFIAFILLITGFTLNMFHLQGAGVVWGIGVLTAAFGFFLFSLIDRFSYEKSSLMKVSAVIGYIGSALLIVGLGLVLLKWPVAVYLAESGSVLLLIYFILNNAISRNVEQN